MPASFTHGFAFDPSYDYSLDELLNVGAPLAPRDLCCDWRQHHWRRMATLYL